MPNKRHKRNKTYNKSVTTTIIGQLLISSSGEKEQIDRLMAKFQSAKRMAFNQIIKDGITKREDIEKYIKTRIPSLNTRYMRDAIIEAEGTIDSQKELLPVYLEDTEHKLKKSQTKLLLYESGKRKAKRVPLETVVKAIKKRIDKLTQRAAKLKHHIINGTIPNIVFGKRRNLIRLQKQLLTKEEWKDLRTNSFYSRGDASKGGNLHTRIYYNDHRDEFKIRIAIPQEGSRCRYIYCPLIIPKEKRHTRKREVLISAIQNKMAYSVRIIRRDHGYEAHITLDEEVYGSYVKKIPHTVAKVAGIDVNVDRIAVTITDKKGNFLKQRTFYCHELEYVRTGKRNFIIYHTIKEVFEWLKSQKVEAIAIERLNFKQDFDSNRRLNRIFSNFVRKRIYDAITRKALRDGMYIKPVHPAFTSQIGKLKYARQYGLSIHEAAAYVIARRGLEYTERIPRVLVKQIPILVDKLELKAAGAKEAARKKLLAQIRVLKNWKKYSPVNTKHRWKLWSLLNKLESLLCPEFPTEGRSGINSKVAPLTGVCPCLPTGRPELCNRQRRGAYQDSGRLGCLRQHPELVWVA